MAGPEVVDLFVHQIVEGQWDESLSLLQHSIGVMDETTIKSASFVILEQKYFEFLAEENLLDALETVKTEIAPIIGTNDARLKELCFYLACRPQYFQKFPDGSHSKRLKLESRKELFDELRRSKLGPRKKLLDELRKLLYPTVLIPERSLVNLPTQRLQILLLQEHDHKILFLQFSHSGKYLASSSGDCLVIVWEVVLDGHVSLKNRLRGHQKPVSSISWSPDDDQLLTCGVEEVVRRWNVASGQCLHTYEKGALGLVSCAWASDGKSIFSGVNDKSISMWDLEGNELECWEGQRTTRIADLGITSSQKELISVCKENTIMLFGWESKSKRFIEEEEDQVITSFSLSEDGKLLLVSLLNDELHLWNIDGCTRLLAKYKGHKSRNFVVRSCFGGRRHAFIASGSEDSQVYIWHRLTGELILTLAGHSGPVNCVSWNPTNFHMLASASDDGTMCIWGLNQNQGEMN